MVGKRLRSAWLPNLEGGLVSFLIEAVIVAVLVSTGVALAAVALWIF